MTTAARFELRPPPLARARREQLLRALRDTWSSTPEVGSRSGIVGDGLDGDLYALEREGIVASVKSHSSRYRRWRLTERGAAERRDLAAMSAPNIEE